VAKLPPQTNSSYKFDKSFIEQENCNKVFPFTCNGQNVAKFCPFYFFEKKPT
jgi:Zn-finger protein